MHRDRAIEVHTLSKEKTTHVLYRAIVLGRPAQQPPVVNQVHAFNKGW